MEKNSRRFTDSENDKSKEIICESAAIVLFLNQI